MENSVANQLPEVDSLPDGFVESSVESIAPTTPSNEMEKPLTDHQKHRIGDTATVKECVTVHEKAEKVPKVRTFPVQLSDKDGYDASGESADVSDDGVAPESMTTVSAVSEGSQTAVQNSKSDGGTNVEALSTKDAESSDTQKSRKEVPEVKRKASKRSIKTEQEFLEFTLKYKHVIAERDAAIAVRDKLESLCRELQRQNKLLMDEFKRVSEEGQSLRLDLSTKFEDAIKNSAVANLDGIGMGHPESVYLHILSQEVKDVSNKLDEQKGESLSQLKENEMLRVKLKQLAEQYTLSQQQYAQELKQKTLELKIAELKIQQNEEKVAHEQAQMKVYAEKISQLLETEKSLRLQLTADGEKFQQFQDALLKSNEVFETFKQEIEKMAKHTKELKKENSFLKSKCEKSDFTLIELVEERERMKKQIERTKNQKDKLESLCRSLQAERKQSSDVSGPAKSTQLHN